MPLWVTRNPWNISVCVRSSLQESEDARGGFLSTLGIPPSCRGRQETGDALEVWEVYTERQSLCGHLRNVPASTLLRLFDVHNCFPSFPVTNTRSWGRKILNKKVNFPRHLVMLHQRWNVTEDSSVVMSFLCLTENTYFTVILQLNI